MFSSITFWVFHHASNGSEHHLCVGGEAPNTIFNRGPADQAMVAPVVTVRDKVLLPGRRGRSRLTYQREGRSQRGLTC